MSTDMKSESLCDGRAVLAENTSVAVTSTQDNGREIDHSLFEGSSSEDEGRSQNLCGEEGRVALTTTKSENEERGNPSATEIDHDLFAGSSSDEEKEADVRVNDAVQSPEAVVADSTVIRHVQLETTSTNEDIRGESSRTANRANAPTSSLALTSSKDTDTCPIDANVDSSSCKNDCAINRSQLPRVKKKRRPLPQPLVSAQVSAGEVKANKTWPTSEGQKNLDLWASSSSDDDESDSRDFRGRVVEAVAKKIPKKRKLPVSRRLKESISHNVASKQASKRALVDSEESTRKRSAVNRFEESLPLSAAEVLAQARAKANPSAAATVPEQHSLSGRKEVQKKISASAAAALAEARARVKESTEQKGKITDKLPLSSPALRNVSEPTSSSSVPIKAGRRTSSPPPPLGIRRTPHFYAKVELEQYWRSIRNWDFVPALNSYVAQSHSAEERTGPSAPPLPDAFESTEQYKSLWAPLLLREAKSQTLSDISSSWNGSNGMDASFVKVQRIGGEDSDVHSECITVKVREVSSAAPASHIGGTGAGSFVFQNETILLINDLNILEQAAKGNLTESFSSSSIKWGLLGNALSRNKGVDGLTIKVSRRLWISSGAPEMQLYRLGSNVTALREFTALCRTDSIPLSGYLLGKKMPPKGESHRISATSDPLSDRGGVNALPPGFRIYVKAKFNPSQLKAISAAAREYGGGGFTLVKGPPGTGKTTTLVALLNALHLRQYQRYYSEIERITTEGNTSGTYEDLAAIHAAAKVKPRILVCAPSNAAVDNVILKIVEVQFVDGVGKKYRPSIVRVGAGQSSSVRKVSLQAKTDAILAVGNDPTQLESIIAENRKRLKSYQREIQKLQRRVRALANASPYTLSNDWEIRIDEETFDRSGKVVFICHRTHSATFDLPPPPQPHETLLPTKEMPHYRNNVDNLVRYVEKYNEASSQLEQYVLLQNALANVTSRNYSQEMSQLHSMLETNILDSEHIVLTTLGTAGSKTMELSAKFEVVVVDEAAQCSEPATLVGLQLGSSHALLVGDPQQLPATIFSLSGRSTKYDRSLFQRLEEAGHEVHMLDTQYRMNPAISSFPRRIFYDNCLLDGPNVRKRDYGGKLDAAIIESFPFFQHFTILDLDSSEERGGTSLSNADEAQLTLHLFSTLDKETVGAPSDTRVAVITPYSQQVALLRRMFSQNFGESYSSKVEISTVDAFQGREACIVIFSCVRAAHKGVGIGFLSDVQRMNVALTRAKHFLFVIARCRTIVVNPYWRDLVGHARERRAIIHVPMKRGGKKKIHEIQFPDLSTLTPLHTGENHGMFGDGYESEGEFSA